MAKSPENKPPAGPKVSPARTIVSLLLLLVVGVVCAIELRAGLGQYLTDKAWKEISEEGGFTKKLSLDEAKAMAKMFPKTSLHSEDDVESVTKLEWYSFLRPLMGESNPTLYLAANKGDTPMATGYFSSLDEGDQFKNVPANPEVTDRTPPGQGPSESGMSGPPPGMMLGPGGPGGGGGAPGGRRGERPPVEEEEAPKSDAPATEAPAAETPAAEAPATETPASDPPAAEAPATETPATEPPAGDAPVTPPSA